MAYQAVRQGSLELLYATISDRSVVQEKRFQFAQLFEVKQPRVGELCVGRFKYYEIVQRPKMKNAVVRDGSPF